MKLKPYPKYKDSGVQWIGKIPEGWEVKRLRFNALVNPSGKKALSNPKTLVNFLPMEKVSENGEYEQESEAEYQDVSTGYTYFEDNDVLVAKITPCFENGKGALVNNLKFGFGFGTTEFHVIRSYSHLMPKYLFYLTKTHLFRVTGEAFMEGAAGQKRVSTDFIKDFIMATPPLPDQTTIASFLDKRTARFDALIEKDKKLIALLKEKRTALIDHVVTKGLDSNAKMKNSEVEWIDKIPQHWLKLKGKHIGKIFNSISVDLEANSDENEQILFLQVDDLNEYNKDNIIFDSKIKFAKNHNKVYSKKMLIFPKRGAAIFTNKVNIVEKPFMCDSNLMAFQIMMGVTEYYRYQIYARRLDDIADVSTIPQINNKHIYPLAFISPPIAEQKKIVEYLDKATSQIDSVIKKIEEKIMLIEENKKSLIHYVVTGKVDVRKSEI